MLTIDPIRAFGGGIVALGFGLWRFTQKRNRLKTWVQTTGTVSNIRSESDSKTIVRVRYLDGNREQQGCSLLVTDGDRLGLGSEIRVAYNPRNPSEAFIADRKDMNLDVILSIATGTILIAAGIVSMIYLDG